MLQSQGLYKFMADRLSFRGETRNIPELFAEEIVLAKIKFY